MKWFIKCIKNYVNFSGRACRKEYWYFTLFTLIFMLVATTCDIALFSLERAMVFSPFQWIFGLFILLPQLAVLVRRLHDTNRSGKWVLWYYLLFFVWAIIMLIYLFYYIISMKIDDVPADFVAVMIAGLGFCVWTVFFLVWCCQRGTVGTNKYGPDPLAVEE